MKLIFLILLSMFLSCCSVKKEYVCGDRPCLDKKDFKEYFSKNLSIEIKPQEKNKTLSADLVKINTKSFAKNKKENIGSKKSKRLELKENKRKLKIERNRLKEEKTHTVTVEADDNGELFLPIPVELLSQMGWDFGDTLIWEENFDRIQNTYTLRKKDT